MTSGLQASGALEVVALEKIFIDQRNEPVHAVDRVSFTVEEGSFYTLLGPSGCGKTTTLRCVAGLEKADGGRVTVAGVVVSDGRAFVPPHKRDIGMVFQSYAIWPHLTVFENVAFPLEVLKNGLSRQQISQRVEEALVTVRLGGYEGRMATRLSGGQQQRLALARALVRRPKLLLLDEPLSNLDAKLRAEMRTEIRALQRQLGLTTLYVTHDQAEAFSMSSRIAVLDGGRIVQEGTPRDVYLRPATRFVANFVGATNFISARVLGRGDDGLMQLETALGGKPIVAQCPSGVSVDAVVTVSIRPENIEIYPAGTTPRSDVVNVYSGRIEEALFVGEFLDVRVTIGRESLATRLHPMFAIKAGDVLQVGLPCEWCSVLSDQGAAGQVVSAESPGDARTAPSSA